MPFDYKVRLAIYYLMLSPLIGVQTYTVYWPAKISEVNKVVLFKLQFWDAGENALKKFDYLLPVSFSLNCNIIILNRFNIYCLFRYLFVHVILQID